MKINHKTAKKMTLPELLDLVYETIKHHGGDELPKEEVEELNKSFPGYPNSPFNFDQWYIVANKYGDTLTAHLKSGGLIPFATYQGTLAEYTWDRAKI